MREITQGLVFDLAPLAVGAAKQMGLVNAALIDACRRGYMDGTGSSRHIPKIPVTWEDVKLSPDILVATFCILHVRVAPFRAVA